MSPMGSALLALAAGLCLELLDPELLDIAQTGVAAFGLNSYVAAPALMATIAHDLAENLALAATMMANFLARLQTWIAHSYAHVPALVLGLATLLAIPPLALLGLLLRRRRSTINTPGPSPLSDGEPLDDTVTTGGGRNDGLTWPVDAWIEVDGTVHGRHPVTRELLRIGREDDNDIVLPLQTVHRYHAVIQRTDDAEIVVMDLSSRQGNGVVVNGKRISRQRLANGDIIQLGESRLTYSARRV